MGLQLENNIEKQPAFLYKYCPFEKNHLDNIIKNQIFFSSPKDFDDPRDCYLDYDFFTGNTKQKCQFHIEATKFSFPQYSNEELKIIVKKNMKKPEFKSHQLKKQYETYFQNNLGVCCFTQSFTNKLLWEERASGFTGFCIEFNYEKLESKILYLFEKYRIAIQPFKAIYYKDLPKINGYIDTLQQKTEKQVSAKRIKFKDEDEIRLVYFDGAKEKIVLFDKSITKIFIGKNILPIDKIELLNIISKYLPNTKVFEMTKNDDSISFIEVII